MSKKLRLNSIFLSVPVYISVEFSVVFYIDFYSRNFYSRLHHVHIVSFHTETMKIDKEMVFVLMMVFSDRNSTLSVFILQGVDTK